MKKIMVRGKQIEVPFEDADYRLDGEKDVEIQNPFSGESIDLPAFAACVYDYTIYKNMQMEKIDTDTNQTPGFSDHQDGWQVVRNGIDFFRRYFAKEYMVLLD